MSVEHMIADGVAEQAKAEADRIEEETGERPNIVVRYTEDDLLEDEEETPDRQFDSFEDLVEANTVAEDGVWVDFPHIPGMSVLISDSSEAAMLLAQRAQRWRAEMKRKGKKIRPDTEAPIPLIIEWSREIAFGRYVKAWRGLPSRDGGEVAFTKLAFEALSKTRQFQSFMNEQIERVRNATMKVSEEDRGNS